VNLDAITHDYPAHVAWLQGAYEKALAESGFDAVVVHGGAAKKRSGFDDQWWPLRATPHFQHWVALSEPGAALVVRAGRRPTLLRVTAVDYWEHAVAPESDHFVEHFTIVGLRAADDAKAHVPDGRVAFVGDEAEIAARWGIAAVNPPALVQALDALRVHKTLYERRCLAEANRRAAQGHAALRRAFYEGASSELELHLAYLAITQQDDPETPYKNIVAFDANAATLHHVAYARRRPGEGGPRTLLLDAGATCLGYCSDITRTWVRDGGDATSAVFRGLVEGVEALQQRLCAAVAVGMNYEALHDRAHDEVGALLAATGVVRCSGDEAVAAGLTRAFFPHGLGHSLGLQCHDVGCALLRPRADNPFLRNTSAIEVGQVFTIEPGLYFIDALLRPVREGDGAGRVDWALVDALAPFGGIRIEDDLVVTGAAGGGPVVDNLTRAVLPEGGGAV
jgi:Xaa-Pro dipeptidase